MSRHELELGELCGERSPAVLLRERGCWSQTHHFDKRLLRRREPELRQEEGIEDSSCKIVVLE